MTSVPSVPRTWRPTGTQIVATVGGVLVTIMAGAFWIALEPGDRDSFTTAQLGTLGGIWMVFFVAWVALILTRITATDEGIVVVNGFRRHRFEWSQVFGINLRRGAPWAGLDLSDGTSNLVFAIQATDGFRAVTAVREIRALIAAHTPDPTA